MTRNQNRFTIIGLAMMIMTISCKHEIPEQGTAGGSNNGGGTGGGTGTGGGAPQSNCDPNLVYYQQQVQPILTSNCTMSGCHDVSRPSTEGVVLTSYQNVMSTADVDPYDPSGSKLYRVLVDNDPDDRMPLNRPPLTQAQISIIYKWIQQGARDLTCVSSCDTTNVTFSGSIQPILSNKCTGCHGGTQSSGGINLSTYAGVQAKVTDGRLWGAINHLPGFSAMPKNGAKLSDCEISQFKIWIAAGALNN